MADGDLLSGAFGDRLGRALADMQGLAAGFTGELNNASRAMEQMDGQSKRLSRSLSSSLRSAFDKAVFGGAKLSDVFRDLAGSVAGKALNAAVAPVTNAISGGISSLFGGVGNSLMSLFADGSAFASGRVRAFAQGGVVTGPTTFPMRGATGLMGEAGPEAIMPLARGPDGRLGVAAAGGGGGGTVVVNISTPDLDGFRRSRSQVSAQLARAVRRGQGAL